MFGFHDVRTDCHSQAFGACSSAEGKEYPRRCCSSGFCPGWVFVVVVFFFFFFFFLLQTFRLLISLARSPHLPPFALSLLDHPVISNNPTSKLILSYFQSSFLNVRVVNRVRVRIWFRTGWFFFPTPVAQWTVNQGGNTFIFFQLKVTISVATEENLLQTV